MKTGNVVWVDAVNGNDGTGVRGRLAFPFLTLGAAKAAAQSGDTVMVLPGAYSEKNLAKNGVNWHFFNGAVVSYAGGATGGIFDTGTAGMACTFAVTGNGIFRVTSEPSPCSVVKSIYAGDNLKIECDRIEGVGAALDAAGTVFMRCNWMQSSAAACVLISLGGNVQLYAHRIYSSGGPGIDIGGGSLDVTARWIASIGGYGIRFSAGTLLATAYEISSNADCALNYASYYSTLCRIHGARLVSTYGGGSGRAVYVVAGSGNLRFFNCTFIGASGVNAIDCGSTTTIVLHGECVSNFAKGANVTVVGSALTVNANFT